MALSDDRVDMDLWLRVIIYGHEVVYLDIRAFYLLEGTKGEVEKSDEGYE
jgi:hypothetical protein